ncbi:MAG TPA: tetratricopeptide repeat protein [Rhizomicrobium sp.]|nr:tetratricopeptide repeat protein [Rhizomicrobium sp.]
MLKFVRLVLVIGTLAFVFGAKDMARAASVDDGADAAQRGDYITAARIWLPLAERGNAMAQFDLGLTYQRGLGVAQDYNEAARWFRLAAAQGNAEAQGSLGVMFAAGQGVAQDYVEAAKWFRLSAAQGDAKGQGKLGAMYYLGEGIVQDYVRAHMWLNLAAAQGNADALKLRDTIASEMTPAQIAQAQEMAHRCEASHYKDCD